jgi:hypothetical protein
MVTQERLKQVITYFPHTGRLVWNIGYGGKMSGKEAGAKSGANGIRILIDNKNYLAHRLAWL